MISGIWDNEYVQKLGIMDHCNELQIIDAAIKGTKNAYGDLYERPLGSVDIEQLEASWEKEAMDLFIILSKRFEFTVTSLVSNNENYDFYKKRGQRFADKASS